MTALYKRMSELTDEENLLYRALCGELEEIAEFITAIASAQRDRRLAVEWLRHCNLPPAAVSRDGPSEQEETALLREALV